DRVEDALAVPEAPRLGLHLLGTPFEKQAREHAGRPGVRRHDRPRAGPGEAEALVRQGQAGEPRLAADVGGRKLVEGDAVAKTRPDFRVRGSGQEAEDGIVRVANVWVREAGDDGGVVAEILEHLEVGRKRIVLAGFLREEEWWVQPERHADADHAVFR